MSLAVLEVSDREFLFPSEQWFYYWNTSAGLWETQLAGHHSSFVSIPINWAFHCEDGEFVDFGENRPETDLARLASICESLQREVLFFLPVTPLPIFSGGGVPSLLARLPARDLTGMAHAYMNLDGRVNKFYSFFDQRVFQAFQKYVGQLAQHFKDKGVAASVVGLVGGAMENRGGQESFVNYLEDSSRAFDQGFGRFISKNGLGEMNFSGIQEESEAKYLYQQMMQELYLETARESLDDYWTGSLGFSFLGGGPNDIFKRIHSSLEHPHEHVQGVAPSLAYNKIPSAALLSGPSRTPGFMKFLSLVVTPALMKSHLNREQEVDGDERGPEYDPLSFFELYERPFRYSCGAKSWHDTGLKQYLERIYPGTYRIHNHLDSLQARQQLGQWIHCLFGAEIDQAMLNNVLRAFLNGASFIIDTSGMNLKTCKKLECFILENSLEVEVVKYKTEVRRVTLGDGQMLLFEGYALGSEGDGIRNLFWERALSIFEFPCQSCKLDDGVVAVWKRRLPVQSELNFAEIRRVILYNSTDTIRQARILPHTRFKLLRYANEYRVEVIGLHGGVKAMVSSDGHVAIDFGLID